MVQHRPGRQWMRLPRIAIPQLESLQLPDSRRPSRRRGHPSMDWPGGCRRRRSLGRQLVERMVALNRVEPFRDAILFRTRNSLLR